MKGKWGVVVLMRGRRISRSSRRVALSLQKGVI